MPPFMVGREDELAQFREFLNLPAADRPSALEIAGPGGIGKSTLFSACLDLARADGWTVLVARPAESERALAHAALGDLLENLLEDLLPALSPPRRSAMEVALLRRGGLGDVVDARALGAGMRSALEYLSERAPVLIAIDDVQWLDPSSAGPLWFALRRIVGRHIAVFVTRRATEPGDASPLDHVLDHRRLDVGPLSAGAIQALVKQRLGMALPRRVLLRLCEVSGGNPLYALELAAVWTADADPTDEPVIPPKLEDLVRSRLREVPARVNEALTLLAVLGRMPVHAAMAARVTDEFDAAAAAGLVERSGATYSFAQPLLASVLLADLPPPRRRDVHALAAGLVEDPIEATRQRALATPEPDRDLAEQLELAAGSALERGASAVAAELTQHALRLTPREFTEATRRRTLAAVRARDAAGDRAYARIMATDLVAHSRPGIDRAEALLVLHEMERLDRSVEILEEALVEAKGHPAAEAAIHRDLAAQGRLTRGRAWAEGHARQAVSIATHLDDDALAAGCLAGLGLMRFRGGDSDGSTLAEQSYELARRAGDPESVRRTAGVVGLVLTWSGRPDDARAFLEEQLSLWRDRDEPWSANIMWYLALVEIRAGRWALAESYAAHVLELEDHYGEVTPMTPLPAAMVAAHRGDVGRAIELARWGMALAEEHGAHLPGLIATVGMIESWNGRSAAACETLARADRVAIEAGIHEPSMLFWRAEQIESLLELGRVDEAQVSLEQWRGDALRLGRDGVLAATTRCTGLLQAARGEVAAAIETLNRAVVEHEAVGDPFGLARALLALGTVKRKSRMKRPARDDMEAALALFEKLGAAGWLERCNSEIGRIGGRTRRDELTEIERHVAAMVRAGKTNREIAAALFLSERTVASHLTRIYAKTGVRSRTELASKVPTF